jgi:hypothetical protein
MIDHGRYDDPTSEGNQNKYLSGKECIEGCGRQAGTAWGPFWCFECNVKRINRIDAQLRALVSYARTPAKELK